MEKIRTRFAPSPTGFLHIGGVRTALFCWLLAKKHKGSFILRIEDTDQKRKVEEAVNHILDSLKWLEIEPDEGVERGGDYAPYVQSKRKDIYKEHALKLLEEDLAYVDPYTKEELEDLRKEAKEKEEPFKFKNYRPQESFDYDGTQPLRFKVPDNQKVEWDDAIRNKVSFNSSELDDFVILKSDGYPTYNFANVVDDHLMQITHVLRGEEFIPSTPLHILLYQAFGWEEPVFAHLPQVNAEDGKKLSKRHGAASVSEFKEMGYLPGALINFLALLGWNDGTEQEIYTRKELINSFELDDIHLSPAIFDVNKLNWINSEYLKMMDEDERISLAKSYLPKSADAVSDEYKQKVLSLVDERMQYFGELNELTKFFFEEPDIKLSDLTSNKINDNDALELLNATIESLSEIEKFTRDSVEEKLRSLVKSEDTKPGILFPLIRLATTGTRSSPPLFDTIETMGKKRVLKRLNRITDK